MRKDNVMEIITPEEFFRSMHDIVTGHCAEGYKDRFQPEQILKRGRATIFFWKDGSKTVVKRSKGEPDDTYSAFVNALAKKMFGSRTAVKKLVDGVVEDESVSASREGVKGNGTV